MTATFVFNKLTVAFAILTLNYSIAVQETPYKNITIPEFDVSCHSDSECLYFLDSSCKTDPEDGKTRCLCGDMSQPRGRGSCRHSKKGLHRDCDVDEDCIEGAICKPEAVVGFPEEYKACQCMECYFEMNYLCVWTTNEHCLSLVSSSSKISAGLILTWHSIIQLFESFK